MVMLSQQSFPGLKADTSTIKYQPQPRTVQQLRYPAYKRNLTVVQVAELPPQTPGFLSDDIVAISIVPFLLGTCHGRDIVGCQSLHLPVQSRC